MSNPLIMEICIIGCIAMISSLMQLMLPHCAIELVVSAINSGHEMITLNEIKEVESMLVKQRGKFRARFPSNADISLKYLS